MTIGFLLQWVLNLSMVGGVALCLIKVLGKKEDDPRLTQGLRLLQSKISILEDLSQHTEHQVKQLMTLLDKKLDQVRATMNQVHEHIGDVDRSIEKGRQMAEKIQNEMTPDHIVERKLENKYIQAAQLAHKGYEVDEIVEALHLPKAEVQLIAKINRKKCVYPERGQSLALFSNSLEMPPLSGDLTTPLTESPRESADGFRSLKLG